METTAMIIICISSFLSIYFMMVSHSIYKNVLKKNFELQEKFFQEKIEHSINEKNTKNTLLFSELITTKIGIEILLL